jgi:uncharacterized membrane protein
VFTVEASCVVGRPLDPVFAYLADFRNAPQWQSQLSRVHYDDGPFPTGRRVTEVHRMFGVDIEAHGELTHWDPPHAFAVEGTSGLLRVASRYSFRTGPGGTRVGLQLTLTARGPARFGEPMLKRAMERDLRGAFERLAANLAALEPG